MASQAGSQTEKSTECRNEAKQKRRGIQVKLSARNVLEGTVTAIHPGAVNAIVILEIEGGQLITSSLSMGSLKDLGLEVGMKAYAIIKASSVIIGVDD